MRKIQNMFDGMRKFLEEVKVELKKCTWPTRKELYESTLVVVFSVVILATFVGISDTIFVYLLRYLVG